MDKLEPRLEATSQAPTDLAQESLDFSSETSEAAPLAESSRLWEVAPQEVTEGEVTSPSTASGSNFSDGEPLMSEVEAPTVGLPAVVASPLVTAQTSPPGAPDESGAPGVLSDYVIRTSQEVDALMRAASDGKSGSHWVTDDQAFTRSHVVPGAPHHVQIAMSEDERAAGGPLKVLEDLTLAQDPDFNFALLYVSQVLAPPSPLPANLAAMEWIDLDDVMDKIGWTPRSTRERLEMRRRVWRYLQFGARASIVGQRSSEYIDKKTGQRIETIIDAPPWAVLEREKPSQPQLFPEIQETPLRVRLVASPAWTRLTTLPETAQYLPMGELLGAIPGNKPSGAWARVLGLALANFWRRQPRAAIDGALKPTRRELLERYTPKAAPPSEVLGSRASGKNPTRAIEYWHGALMILIECGFLAPVGEAALSLKAMRERLPRKEWQEFWLDERVELRPGAVMRDAVQSCASALPNPKPRAIKAPGKRKKRGRPRKETAPAPREDGSED